MVFTSVLGGLSGVKMRAEQPGALIAEDRAQDGPGSCRCPERAQARSGCHSKRIETLAGAVRLEAIRYEPPGTSTVPAPLFRALPIAFVLSGAIASLAVGVADGAPPPNRKLVTRQDG